MKYKVIIPVHYYGGDPAAMGLGNNISLQFESEKDARKAKRRADKCFKRCRGDTCTDGSRAFVDKFEDSLDLCGWGFIDGLSKIYEVIIKPVVA